MERKREASAPYQSRKHSDRTALQTVVGYRAERAYLFHRKEWPRREKSYIAAAKMYIARAKMYIAAAKMYILNAKI